jgi:hypothetical protein
MNVSGARLGASRRVDLASRYYRLAVFRFSTRPHLRVFGEGRGDGDLFLPIHTAQPAEFGAPATASSMQQARPARGSPGFVPVSSFTQSSTRTTRWINSFC